MNVDLQPEVVKNRFPAFFYYLRDELAFLNVL